MCEHNDRGLVNNIYQFQSFIASGTELYDLTNIKPKNMYFQFYFHFQLTKLVVFMKNK